MVHNSSRAGIAILCMALALGALAGCTPPTSTPTVTPLANVSAQYIAFYSATKAYVSVANYGSTGGVYTFNPSNPSAGLTGPITGTDATGFYLQQIIVGPDGKIYVADNGTVQSPYNYANQVLQIDPSTDTLSTTTFTASVLGTTALASGTYKGNSGVFVGNITYANTGSIDFINTSIATPSISEVLGSLDVSRLLYLSTGDLVTTSYTNSYLVTGLSVSGTPAKTEMGSNLGGVDIATKDGFVYVGYTNYSTSKLYVFDTSGAAEPYSPVSVSSVVAGLAFGPTNLYMTDTYTGKVYTYSPSAHTVSSTSFVSTNQNATGSIYFYNNIGYIAVGSSTTTTAPGVYDFNPSASVPTAVQVGSGN